VVYDPFHLRKLPPAKSRGRVLRIISDGLSMRIKPVAAVFAAVMFIAPAATLAHGSKKSPRQYYVALGDSLSRGGQPNANGKTGPTNQGYTNDLFHTEKKKFKNLHFVNLGCPGETTTTMIKGGTCGYAAGSQLAAAVQFLNSHRGHIAFVTIDIGGDDVGGCTPGQNFQACLNAADTTIQTNLPRITRKLRKATGRKVPIVGMTYYDPYVASWLAGKPGQKAAASSQPLVKTVNKDIASAYRAKNFEVAPVANAFHSYESLTKKKKRYHHQEVPVPVAVICKKTWMCAAPPVGPDIHCNASGYLKIAKVFEKEKL
jgi:lysophospholipase L1-like esterase